MNAAPNERESAEAGGRPIRLERRISNEVLASPRIVHPGKLLLRD
jgi:hypothetical protein